MSWYPFLVDCAWHTLSAVLLDWQKNPSMWSRERDFQVELASRLTNVYRQMGNDHVQGFLSSSKDDNALLKSWARVACEPHLQYRYKDDQRYGCHPDIVVWDSLPSFNWTPDWENDQNWPVLWACEIKYGNNTPSKWDQEKLTYLVQQDHIRFGCWVKIKHRKAKSGNGWSISKGKCGNRLWIYEIELPKLAING